MTRQPRDWLRYRPSAPLQHARWIAPARRRGPSASVPRALHPVPVRTSLQRVPLLLDPAFALRRAPRRPGPRAGASKVVAIRRMLSALG